jgi:hypothetical protein
MRNSASGIRTRDLQVMSLASYRTAPPREPKRTAPNDGASSAAGESRVRDGRDNARAVVGS